MVSLSVIFHLHYNSVLDVVVSTLRRRQRWRPFITNTQRPHQMAILCQDCFVHGLKHLVVVHSCQHNLGLYWHLSRFWCLPYCARAAFSSNQYCFLFCHHCSFSPFKPNSALHKNAAPLWSSKKPTMSRGRSHSISLASSFPFNLDWGSAGRFFSLPQDSLPFVLLPRGGAHELGESHLLAWGQELWKF